MLHRAIAIFAFTSIFSFAACSRTSSNQPAANAATSLSAKAGDNPGAPGNHLFARENLTATRTNALAEYILPEVRSRLDAEPVSRDEDPLVASPPEVGDSSGDTGDSHVSDADTLPGEDAVSNSDEIEKMKFSWAQKKKFGEALRGDQAANGVLVLYADETYYDVGRLMNFIEEGRNIMAANSEIDPRRIKVVYGGYRGLAQVEFWVIPQGEQVPDFKPDNKDAANGPEDH
jgi:hypothetical protein